MTMTYTARTFRLPELKGISQKQVEVHLGLYEGYVKHVNLIMEKVASLREDNPIDNAYLMNELRRRLGFEFDGMRMHEYYFEQLEESATPPSDSALSDAASKKYGSWDLFIAHIKEVAGTRGIGWVVVYFDPKGRTLHTTFVNDHELGQLAGLPIVLALDLWEHAYMVDYVPAQKNEYVEAFLNNLNWDVVERRFVSSAV
ncbi:MAG TPA: Fe-Mn family superoxide dismutase [Candidatus Paceibacterota bacterium]|jgi:Fe-Mn family superoxide dismutase